MALSVLIRVEGELFTLKNSKFEHQTTFSPFPSSIRTAFEITYFDFKIEGSFD